MARKTQQQLDDEALGYGIPEDPDVDKIPPGMRTTISDAAVARAHCADLGIDPDSVSDAVRQLSKKFSRGPLEILWAVADAPDGAVSASARAAAAQSIMPYLQSRPKEVKEAPKGAASGVMEIPLASSMEEWTQASTVSQAKLMADVRK